jgi:hypothetical protein
MKKRTYILENKPKGAEVTPEMVKLLVHKNETGYIPFANIQTSNFTAVNLVAYSTNGTLTVTDPTPETNKGYIVHVVGGTTTIDGVGYTAGALVYRFYDGADWTSKDYGALPSIPKQVLSFDYAEILDSDTFRSAPIFNGSEYYKFTYDTSQSSVGSIGAVPESYFGKIYQNCVLKKIQFFSLFNGTSITNIEVAVFTSDDFEGSGSALLYNQAWTDITDVNQDLNIAVNSGKFIHLFIKSPLLSGIKSFKLEFQ